ncbi:MAG: hypothetical protein A2W52_00475 [Candidatus Taylorbacteria bacterium RIFCSPHIGHO2_02_49_25]|uniref:PrgI family protein n=1 Tax=Candidatus Taylorbacteria bacterium RIFCSPHIGHO2_02_49_25 TaxID=1802305 RepID=A0A1G2MGN9_9BACT|nr:MAG: hypothetical protein UY62_C0009G0014 [Parcubacteria group bacterium GW2011_GWF2_50_9]OHA20689.1 MAG: hypothetical protein A2759_03695 [Candidatus Taylorbacteria bacterium RIFCSPHIGHO2_01_FULL_49_60]OHA23070.1 MAG: hypothetical protein A2W52_00475 [Candidatus Taylorbacteria bacterium RIFCSPHIGHO2_02_49_25]OHA36570.1 MAG: hypothetical protein A3B27_03285 [Candidatus Taylorbacteria bacterium RIFCSPLOWO2_01_FULL_50_130]OHA36818.1 MAG: hypothetical protein A2W65_00130 [Candidatus Taylorbacte
MRFQVPQFINIEDKIFGPLTVLQFVYLVGGGGMVYIAYHLLPLYLGIFIIAPAATLALALAFLKPNGKPFVYLLQSALTYMFSNRLYVWRRAPKQMTPKDAVKEFSGPGSVVPSLSESKLKDLTWALDINQNVKKK